MSTKLFVLVMTGILMLTEVTSAQEPGGADNNSEKPGTTNLAGLLPSVDFKTMLQIASDLRKASESLSRFGESLKDATRIAAEASGSTSENLAAIGGEFDPFGFKTAFLTIQQQNAIIQAQSRMIIELQQKEIRRLKQKSKTSTRPKRQSRRRRISRARKSSEESESPD